MWQTNDEIADGRHDAEGGVVEVFRLGLVVGEGHADAKERAALCVGGAVAEGDGARRRIELVGEVRSVLLDEGFVGVRGVESAAVEHAVGGDDDTVGEVAVAEGCGVPVAVRGLVATGAEGGEVAIGGVVAAPVVEVVAAGAITATVASVVAAVAVVVAVVAIDVARAVSAVPLVGVAVTRVARVWARTAVLTVSEIIEVAIFNVMERGRKGVCCRRRGRSFGGLMLIVVGVVKVGVGNEGRTGGVGEVVECVQGTAWCLHGSREGRAEDGVEGKAVTRGEPRVDVRGDRFGPFLGGEQLV